MTDGSAVSKRADGTDNASAHCAQWLGLNREVHLRITNRVRDFLVEDVELTIGRDVPAAQRQHRSKDTGHSGGRLQVSNITLNA
jgi:hypothetical protein